MLREAGSYHHGGLGFFSDKIPAGHSEHSKARFSGATKPKMHLNSDDKYSILATGGNDSIVKIWKVYEEVNKSGMCEFVQELTGHGSTIMSLSFSPKTGKYLASTSGDKTIRIWNSASLVCFRVLDGKFT